MCYYKIVRKGKWKHIINSIYIYLYADHHILINKLLIDHNYYLRDFPER